MKRCEALVDGGRRGLLVHFGKLDVEGGQADCAGIGGDGTLIAGAFDVGLNGNRLSPPPAPVTLTFSVVVQNVLTLTLRYLRDLAAGGRQVLWA